MGMGFSSRTASSPRQPDGHLLRASGLRQAVPTRRLLRARRQHHLRRPSGQPERDGEQPRKADPSTGTRTDYTFFIKDRNAATNLAGEPFCGTVKISTYTPAGSAEATGTSVAISTLHSGISSAKAAAAVALMTDIDNWVATMPSDWTQPGWNNVNSAQFNSIVKTREDALVAQITAQASGSEASINNGWTPSSPQ
jgi:hypothetical protein